MVLHFWLNVKQTRLIANDGFYRYYKEVRKQINERDYVLLWNLMPSDYDEAVALIPNLQNTDRESVVKIVNFLNEKRGMSRQNWASLTSHLDDRKMTYFFQLN